MSLLIVAKTITYDKGLFITISGALKINSQCGDCELTNRTEENKQQLYSIEKLLEVTFLK